MVEDAGRRALILDVAAAGALLGGTRHEVLVGAYRKAARGLERVRGGTKLRRSRGVAVGRAAGAGAGRLWVLGVRAAELVHEVGDDAVEVEA